MAIPLFISQILKYFDGTSDLKNTLIYATLMSIGIAINCVVHHPYFLGVGIYGMKIRLACAGLLYKKSFKLNLCGLNSESGGQLINLLANDGGRVEFMLFFVPYLFIGPLQAIFTVIMLIKLIDVTILSGLFIMVIAIPSQSLLGKVYDRLR